MRYGVPSPWIRPGMVTRGYVSWARAEPARDLAEDIDGNDESRLYVLIDPNVDIQRSDPSFGIEGRGRKSVPLLQSAGHLVKTVTEQAAVRDWIKAMKVNNRLTWSDDALKALAPFLSLNTAHVPDLRKAAERIALERWAPSTPSSRATPEAEKSATERLAREIELWRKWLASEWLKASLVKKRQAGRPSRNG